MQNKNGLLSFLPQGPAPMPPPTVLASPFNDAQLVSFVAAMLNGPPTARERVALAVEIVAESCVAVRGNALAAAMKKIEGEDATT